MKMERVFKVALKCKVSFLALNVQYKKEAKRLFPLRTGNG
jgi:hypothetical protein